MPCDALSEWRCSTVQAPTDAIDAEVGCCMGPFYRAGPIAPDFDIYETTPILADRAVAYIERASATEQPFFLYLPLPLPSPPFFFFIPFLFAAAPTLFFLPIFRCGSTPAFYTDHFSLRQRPEFYTEQL